MTLYLLIPFLTWLVTGGLKFVINCLKEKRLAFDLIGYGGMPSNHSAIVSSITTLVGLREGINSPAFGVALAFTFIVILDASSLRRQMEKVDAVLIAPGTLPDQEKCEEDISALSMALSINGTATITLMQLIANELVKKQSGVLAVISSPAGDRGRQSNYVYGAAKGAVAIYAQGLRNRLFSKNVHVITIKPGFVDTPMTSEFDKSGPLWAKPEKVANDIVRGIDKKKNVLYTPWFWFFIMQIIKNIPERIFKRLSL